MLWTFANVLIPNQGPGWNPSSFKPWQSLGGVFPIEPAGPVVASWNADRLDVFAVGFGPHFAMFHKWAEGSMPTFNDWQPAYPLWEDLGGSFGSAPAVVSLGNNRLDIFALGAGPDFVMRHKSWNPMQGWTPPTPKWQQVGDGHNFRSAPAVTASGSNQLDVFALGNDNRMYHISSGDGGTTWPTPWLPLGDETFRPA